MMTLENIKGTYTLWEELMIEFMGDIRITTNVIRSPHYPCLCVNSS
jgi:hypothetical protein